MTPIDAFAQWYAEAQATEPRVPDAAQIATVDAEGRPSVRTVLVKGFSPAGFDFFTNHGSRKARQLAATGRAALCFHWKTLERQVLAEGPVQRLSEAESDAYFATRPRGSQVGAWASRQSEELASWRDLEAAVEETARRFEGRDVPRPPFWGGYRLLPERVELWQGRADRLHERTLYLRDGDTWTRHMLFP